VIALTYGSSADWVRNVLAAGGCELESRRRHYQLGAPRLYRDENASDMPAFIRFMLRRVIKAPEFLSLDVVGEVPATASSRSKTAAG
jgi:hypothetical protein